MGRKYHAECDYCGATEGTNWRKKQFRLYCSTDCERAGDIPIWSCGFLVMGSITVLMYTEIELFSFAFPLLLVSVLFTLALAFAVIRGFQARDRVSQRLKEEVIDR